MGIRVLVIDDEPVRAGMLDCNPEVDEVRIAHGHEQIRYYLCGSGRKSGFDIILLDNDMPLMDGLSVVKNFGTDLLTSTNTIVVWSRNSVAAHEITEKLRDIQKDPHWEGCFDTTLVEEYPYQRSVTTMTYLIQLGMNRKFVQ